MKRLFIVAAQMILFLFLDAAGGLFYHPFGVATVVSSGALTRRVFLWDGLIFMGVAYLVLCLIAALRKRLGSFVPGATAALMLAAVAGYALKLGFVTHDL